jgi:hypothetical protein
MAVDAPGQSTNPLDQPARASGVRGRGQTPAPAGNAGANVFEASSAQKIGTEPWVIRAEVAGINREAGRVLQWISLYKVEKKSSLAAAALNQADNTDAVPRSRQPWAMRRDVLPTLTGLLQKFTEWSEVAKKNDVREVHKEIGLIKVRDGEMLYFHREKGSAFSWLIVANASTLRPIYKMTESDVSAIIELLEKLPAPGLQGFGQTPPPKAADSLFK